MPSTKQLSVSAQDEENGGTPRVPSASWRVILLAGVVILLWLVMFCWQFVDLDAVMSELIKSESDAWLFALTIAPLFYLILAVANSWPVIIGIPTSLLIFRFAFNTMSAKVRRWGPIVLTIAIFAGVPIALNRVAFDREQNFFQTDDTVTPISLAGRDVEISESGPVPPAMRWPPRCDDRCILLLSFAEAKSVTRVFQPDSNRSGSKSARATYVLGPIGNNCQDSTIDFPGSAAIKNVRQKGLCAVIAPFDKASDPIVISIKNVARLGEGKANSIGRQLVLIDTARRSQAPLTLTRFVMRRYPGLLHISWKNGKFRLPRNKMPILVHDRLEDILYSDAFYRR